MDKVGSWKTKFTPADIRLIQKMQEVLSSIEKHTIDQKKRDELKRRRMHLHDIRVKMLTVNQDMHFAF